MVCSAFILIAWLISGSLLFSSPGGNAPVILEHLHDAYALEGDMAEFECRVKGEPQPEVAW